MIVKPTNKDQWNAMAHFLHEHAHVHATLETRYVGWVEHGQLKMVIALNAFLGKTCQIHVAMSKGYHFTPRAMLDEVFKGIFKELGIKTLIGVVNSNNKKALRYDLHLGFKEVHRLPGMHDDGGDIVLLTMTPETCKYLQQTERAA